MNLNELFFFKVFPCSKDINNTKYKTFKHNKKIVISTTFQQYMKIEIKKL